MKQRHNRLSLGIQRAKIAAFVTIAFSTSKAEIVALALSAMFLSNDMVDFVDEQPILLMHATVFTTSACPVSDFTA